MSGESLRALFEELQPLAETAAAAPDAHENLIGILEVMAVADGKQTASLYGDGARDPARLDRLEDIARRHGLLTQRTPRPIRHWHRPPDLGDAIIAWETEVEQQRQRTSPDALWIYSLDWTGDRIADVVAGRSPYSSVGGHPHCCVWHYSENVLMSLEDQLRAIVEHHAPASPEALLEMWTSGVVARSSSGLKVDPRQVLRDRQTSRRKFAYVGFAACPACAAGYQSPAAVMNWEKRILAFTVSPWFGRRIWEARDENLDEDRWPRDAGAECPCGSSRPFGECCAAIA